MILLNLPDEIQIIIWKFIKPIPKPIYNYYFDKHKKIPYPNNRRKLFYLKPTIPDFLKNKMGIMYWNTLGVDVEDQHDIKNNISFHNKLHYCNKCGEKSIYISNINYRVYLVCPRIINFNKVYDCCILNCNGIVNDSYRLAPFR